MYVRATALARTAALEEYQERIAVPRIYLIRPVLQYGKDDLCMNVRFLVDNRGGIGPVYGNYISDSTPL